MVGHPSSEGTHGTPNATPKWEDTADSRVILWDSMGHPSSEGTHGTPNVTPYCEDTTDTSGVTQHQKGPMGPQM